MLAGLRCHDEAFGAHMSYNYLYIPLFILPWSSVVTVRHDVVVGKTLSACNTALSRCAPGSAAHPLKAAAWIPLEADLSEANWSALLIAAGFHPELPTVWLAEGLLMYLQPPAVDAMLREMAGAELFKYACSAYGLRQGGC